MVQVLPYIFPGTLTAGGGIAIGGLTLATSTGLTLAGQLINLGLGLLIQSALRDRPDVPRPDDIKLNLRQSVGPRLKHYGEVRAGGTIVFFRTRSGKFYRIVVHGHGRISEEIAYYLDRGQVTLGGDGKVQEAQYEVNGRKRVTIKTRPGNDPATAHPEITAIWPDWDADHRLDGLWQSLTIAEQVPPDEYRKVYPNNEPSIEIAARTTAVYDPRSGTTAYSDNAALCIADFIESPDGLRRAGRVNTAALIAAADECDEAVPLAAGGTEPRYRISGSYGLNEEPRDVLMRMFDACAGRPRLEPDGTIGIEVGQWQAPTVTLRFSDIVEIEADTTGPDAIDRFTELPFTYVDRGMDYAQVTGDPWIDEALEDELGEIAEGPLLNLDLAPSHGQARRCAKIRSREANPRREVKGRFKPRALIAAYERFVTLDAPEIGLTGTFRIRGFSIVPATLDVYLDLAEIGADAFTWSTAEEGTPQALPTPDTPAGIPLPTNFAAAPQGVKVSQSTYSAGIGLAWDAPPSDALSPFVEYKRSADSEWTPVPVAPGATSVQIGGLEDGTSYDARLAFLTVDGAKGAYATETGVTASADATAPAAPTGLTVTDQTGGEALVEVTASASASVWKTEIRRDGTLIATFYSDPGETHSVVDASGAGTFDWTARAINISGVASASDAGPVTQTIT